MKDWQPFKGEMPKALPNPVSLRSDSILMGEELRADAFTALPSQEELYSASRDLKYVLNPVGLHVNCDVPKGKLRFAHLTTISRLESACRTWIWPSAIAKILRIHSSVPPEPS